MKVFSFTGKISNFIDVNKICNCRLNCFAPVCRQAGAKLLPLEKGGGL